MGFPTGAAPSLQPWQLYYNGLTIGEGTNYGVYDIEGLGRPDVRSGDTDRPRDWGQLLGFDALGGRDIAITFDDIPTIGSLWNSSVALDTAFAVSSAAELPLWIQTASGNPIVAVNCRFRKGPRKLDLAYSVGSMAQQVYTLHATDPRIYGQATSQSIGLNPPTGGATFPWTFPLSFGSGGATYINATNGGNVEMRPVLTIEGPCTNPVIGNTTTGWELLFTNPAQTSYTLNAGDLLVIDTDLCSIVYYPNGSSAGSPRRNWLVAGSIWPNQSTGIGGVAPGSNTITFASADTSTVAGTLSVAYASAWASAI